MESTSALRFELPLVASQPRIEVASLCSSPVVLNVAGLHSTVQNLQTMYQWSPQPECAEKVSKITFVSNNDEAQAI